MLLENKRAGKIIPIKLEHKVQEHNEWFIVNWCLGTTCNYSCSYCPSTLHDGKFPWPSPDTIKKFIADVKLNHPNKKIYFEFTGGEVTLYRDFVEIAKYCTEQEIRIGFITNGSRTLRWWEENKQYFDHVCVSYHSEHANPEHFLNVVKILAGSLRTHVNIMMNPSKFDECVALAEQISNLSDISLALQPLIHNLATDLYDYSEKQLEILNNQHQLFINKIKHTKSFDFYRGSMIQTNSDGSTSVVNAQDFISTNTNNWMGWDCNAGVEQLVVDVDGRVYAGWCKVNGELGNIHDDDVYFPTNPLVCTSSICHCNFDIMSSKFNV